MPTAFAAPALYLATCLSIDFLSHASAVPPLHITHWNPASALGIILLLKVGVRGAPWLFLASLIAELSYRGGAAPLGYLIASSAAVAAGYAGVALALTRSVGFDADFRRFADLAWFTAATLLGTLLVSGAYVGIFTLAGAIPVEDYSANLLGYWFDEFIGILVLAPLLLVHWHWRPALAGFRPKLEHVFQFGLLALTLWTFHAFDISDDFLFLPVIWIAMRHGIHGTTLAVLAIQVGLVLSLQASLHRDWSVGEFHFLMASLAITGLALGVAVSERESVSAKLHERDAQLALAMRVVGAGELASSLAHELNQPLSASKNYARASRLILERDPPDLALLGATLDKLQAEVTRAGDAVKHLRAFFQGGIPKGEAHPLHKLVGEAIRNAAVQFEHHQVAIANRVGDDLPVVWVDPIQILIVLQNLIGNAMQSLAKAGTAGAQISLDAHRREDGFVCVGIGDNGPGVPADVRGRLFVTVATTKADGMGLGLMICRSLVEAHGGKLWLDSGEPGQTRFCFTLPTDDSHQLPPKLPAELH